MQLEDHLNEQQLVAATHVEGPMLVIAGAGSGKTRIITYRIAHLIDLGVPSSEILTVTFTNKAADEMRFRIQNLNQKTVLACTFHSLGARILRESIAPLGYKNNFAIFDEDDRDKVLKECMQEFGIKDEQGFKKSLHRAINNAKNTLIEPKDDLEKSIYRLYIQKLKSYNAVDFDDLLFLTIKLFQQESEILARYQKRWSFILIDEYQDVNEAQYTLLKFLSEKHQNIFAVGDPDQSIYSWRGANVENILHFEEDYPGVKIIFLEQNYRSTTTILSAANALINNNESRYEKKLWSDRGEGEKIGFCLCKREQDEVSFVLEKLYHHHYKKNVPLSDCAIFYRTHFQSRAFEDVLLKKNIPYTIVGGISFYLRKEIKDILALLRVANEGADFLSFARTINLPKRGIGPATQSKIRAGSQGDLIAKARDIIAGTSSTKLSAKQVEGLRSYVDTIQSVRHLIANQAPISEMIKELIDRIDYHSILKEDPETMQDRQENLRELISKAVEWQEENVYGKLADFLEELFLKGPSDPTHSQDTLRLMTLHSGKGLEFNIVFLVGLEEGLFPHENSLDSSDALEEERRLCYVGMTRARNYLYLTAARTRFLFGSHRYMTPSRFLSEIPGKYLEKYHEEPFNPYKLKELSDGFDLDTEVYHKDFGKGTIVKVYQTSLGLTYDILFSESNLIRSLVAKYAKLAKT